jgi:lipid-A-disaccharide synthase
MRFLISAGEASGELHGAGIMNALRQRVSNAEFFGVGGQKMRQAGFDSVVDAHAISVVGLAEVVKHLPMIWREFKRLVAVAAARKPDAAILIDFPDFNLRLARELHKLGIPVIYYVSPQLWAWRQGRIKQVQKYVRKMLVIFPFEKEFYAKYGVQAEYVGHPLADEVLPAKSRENFAVENGLDPRKTWIALLPGSRRKEFSLNFSGIMDAANVLGAKYEYVLPIASSLDPAWVEQQFVQQRLNDVPVHRVSDAVQTLQHSRAAIVASGTATLQATLIGTPSVMVYRVTPLTYLVGRRLVKLDLFAMPNLIARREIIPEFVQNDFNGQRVAEKVKELIPDSARRTQMLEDMAEVRSKLHPQGNLTAAQKAADAVLATLQTS